MRFFCLALPFVGAALGVLWWAALALLCRWGASPFLRGAVMTLYALALTGGMHMDGLMDACDAILSRREEAMRIAVERHSRQRIALELERKLLALAGKE